MSRAEAQPDPPYLQIVTEIRRRIAAGELRTGDRVPSTRQIAREWGVAIATATKALTTLSQEGLVQAMPASAPWWPPPNPDPPPPCAAPDARPRQPTRS